LAASSLAAVLVERSMHPQWLSNAYLVADESGGTAVFVDTGAPLGPLFDAVERDSLRVTHLLTTHADHDHVAGDGEVTARYGVPVVKGALETGGLRVEALPTPGHKDDHLAFVVNGETCFSGDLLFKDAVGGGDLGQIRRSVMDVLMKLPPETRVYPGHTDETTIGREWDENPFVRVWRGVEPELGEPVRVGGEEATLVVWSPDYDGKGKAWVRFADGRDAIVGGSRVERKET
jgi:glyoxylase-like metal-dependent hydrolase (beta-lactamase superfamily II)